MSNEHFKDHLVAELFKVLRQIQDEIGIGQISSDGSLLSSLDLTAEKLRDFPDERKFIVLEILNELKQVISASVSLDGNRTDRFDQQFSSLKEKIQSQGIEVGQFLEAELSEQMQQLLKSSEIQQELEKLVEKLRELAKQPHPDLDLLETKISDTIIQPLVQKILVDEEEKFWRQKRQDYKQSARDAIAQSLKMHNIPCFSSGNLKSDSDLQANDGHSHKLD
ncbi:MAG: hypothetical protein QNJ46_10735 [Leptolyngbyaceae cyanobacterium MO_188.B28]|nr:hypothetical protein [Leptolyngbyaceae cyanobacterium MO_188.B28]